MTILIELSNIATGQIAIAECDIPGDTVNEGELLASIPAGYEYSHYWLVEPPAPIVETLRY